MRPVHSNIRPRVAAFARNQRGAALLYVTLLLPVLVGGAVLTIDLGRLASLHTALQNGADALALAGAAELDRKPSAITRADAAIANLTANKDKFALGGSAFIQVASKRYLKTLPNNDANAITAANEVAAGSAGAMEARFVEVVVQPANFKTYFPISLLGGTNTRTVSARAVAGFDAAICRSVPMFICNPYEGTGTSIFDAIADPALRRRQFKLQLGNVGGAGQFFPGNYGWLDSPNIGTGAQALRESLAKVRTTACFVQNGVSQRTGNIESANDALNVRFDMWNGPFNNDSTKADFRPAENVRKNYALGKGKGGGVCDPELVSNPNGSGHPIGRDSDFPYSGGRMGNGLWDFEHYWSSYYGTAPKPASIVGANNANPPTRYEVYQAELSTLGSGVANDLVSRPAVSDVVDYKGSKGIPACYTGGGLSNNPDRRILYVAVLNCAALDIRGNQGGPFPVLAFGRFFLTEPISNPPDPDAGTIFAELTGLAEAGSVSNEVARDIVQLYR